MKNQSTIEVETIENLIEMNGICGLSEVLNDARFLHDETVHFVELDAFTKYDQTSLYFLNAVIEDLKPLSKKIEENYLKKDVASENEIREAGQKAVNELKKTIGTDGVIQYLENSNNLVLFHLHASRFNENVRSALYSLNSLKEAIKPLENEILNPEAEKIKELKKLLAEKENRIAELEGRVRLNA